MVVLKRTVSFVCVDSFMSLTHPLLVRLDLVLNSTQEGNQDDNNYSSFCLEKKLSLIGAHNLSASFTTTFAVKQKSKSFLATVVRRYGLIVSNNSDVVLLQHSPSLRLADGTGAKW